MPTNLPVFPSISFLCTCTAIIFLYGLGIATVLMKLYGHSTDIIKNVHVLFRTLIYNFTTTAWFTEGIEG